MCFTKIIKKQFKAPFRPEQPNIPNYGKNNLPLRQNIKGLMHTHTHTHRDKHMHAHSERLLPSVRAMRAERSGAERRGGRRSALSAE